MENVFTNNTISPGSLPRYESVDYNAVSVKKRHKMLIKISLGLLAAVIAFSFVLYYDTSSYLQTLGGIIIILLFSWQYFLAFQLQKSYGYALREKDLVYRRGYIFEKVTVIPFNRIQHISTSRDVLDKMLDIANLNVYTAGGAGSDIDIPGLDPELAKSLKETIAVKLTAINE